ncbi:MAG: type II secretion system F family protein [Acidimicrobiaceae bacterium]|nr:type II secretion system F family protein [Acidimicrobiaceae bacterium]
MLQILVFGVLAAAGLALVVLSGALSRIRPSSKRVQRAAAAVLEREAVARRKAASERRLSPLMVVQLVAAVGGGFLGWTVTGLLGMMVLLGGLGALLPPFMAAPARRRRQTRQALAWSLWSRQLAELARAGSGLVESLRGSVEHAPQEIAAVVERVAATAEMQGLEEALEELAASGTVWEPEVAAGLRMAASGGGAVADPLFDLCGRIGDVVDLHRSKTEAVVQLWTQTIALLGLAGGVVLMMYRNNPAYFEPYEQGTGQLVFVGIAGLLLLSTSFLVYHSVVRQENSVLVPPRRRNRAKDPI